ncbi:CDP-diacylglycerol--glycerol-3-phosphate 3-phosphatidyltransferase [Bifidobacterium avesanii]|nr:CDP-diacylglycerol--glycerol-3-phosphate 3-phosphatidyltransferase [Bifidobacterium avesanii]KAB8288538.1 CDP-diacylglycerol--glycerol-3-phosphate 3-phosphatidyltransferase [Bifidobacterium avesanii]
MGERNGKQSLLEGWNSAPNLVTYARIALVVVFVVLLVAAGSQPTADLADPGRLSDALPASASGDVGLRWAACIIFLVAASTDKLDGWLARRTNAVTELGKLMDPIADKLLILVTLVVLSVFGEVAWWITVLFLVREIGITVMRFFVIDTGGRVIAAAWPGKLKTLFQCIALTMLLAPLYATGLAARWTRGFYALGMAFLVVALVLCWYSGLEYVIKTVRAAKAAPASNGQTSKE